MYSPLAGRRDMVAVGNERRWGVQARKLPGDLESLELLCCNSPKLSSVANADRVAGAPHHCSVPRKPRLHVTHCELCHTPATSHPGSSTGLGNDNLTVTR